MSFLVWIGLQSDDSKDELNSLETNSKKLGLDIYQCCAALGRECGVCADKDQRL
jgi:hypothetical protein